VSLKAGLTIVFLSCFYASSSFAQTPTPLPNLATLDWSVKQAKILNAKSNVTVSKFINSLPGASGLIHVCSFQFADFHNSGELSLVVSDEGGGTADCNDVDVLEKSGAGTEIYSFSGFFDEVKDINRDGHQELIIDQAFAAGSQTGHCTATWPVIYAWNGNGYGDVSSKYRKYYEQMLSLPDSTASDVKWQDCAKASTAKIERFLGSRNAGMIDATEWAASDDQDTREFGIEILADIRTPAAIKLLRKLSYDRDRKHAHFAEVCLESITKRPDVNPTIYGELLTPDYASPLLSNQPPTPTSH
jgi:hypothetical protein